MSVTVKITPDEGQAMSAAASLQMMRASQNGWVGRDHGSHSTRNMAQRWENGIQGMMAEYAVCKYFGLCWTASADGVKGSDAFGIEVRSTAHSPGHLILHKRDIEEKPDNPFVFATGHWPEFTIHGWMYAKDGGRDEWWRENKNPSSYWVPPEYLSPIEDLKLTPQGLRDNTPEDLVTLQGLLGGYGCWTPELEKELLDWIDSRPREIICTKCAIREEKGDPFKADF